MYLNGSYKGTTSAEFNGLVIEDVRQGSHTIKIVKSGYTPYEETISVKSGEVFAYKVKPFQKQGVIVTEQGNEAVSEKVKKAVTGKLLVQSVPIEIKITIPRVEGIENFQKTKDQWTVDKLLEGTYDIEFVFNNKTINKTFEITGNDVTSIFVNMINGEVTINSSRDERIKKEEASRIGLAKKNAMVRKLCETYYFKPGLTLPQFMNYNTRFFNEIGYRLENYNITSYKIYERKPSKVPVQGPYNISCTNDGGNIVFNYEFIEMASDKDDDPSVYAYYKNFVKKIKEEVPPDFYIDFGNDLSISSANPNVRITISYRPNWSGARNGKGSYVGVTFKVD